MDDSARVPDENRPDLHRMAAGMDLLSDVLGVSMLVDAINNRKPSGATETTVLGPFHVSNAPRYPLGANICLDGKGEPLLVTGRVVDTEGCPIAGALLDVWQANEDGFYDVQQRGVQPDMNLRGISLLRRRWPILVPLGQAALLSDSERMGRLACLSRPSVASIPIVRPTSTSSSARKGSKPITTHLFTPDCPYLHSDAVFGVKASSVADFKPTDDPKMAKKLGMPNPYLSSTGTSCSAAASSTAAYQSDWRELPAPTVSRSAESGLPSTAASAAVSFAFASPTVS